MLTTFIFYENHIRGTFISHDIEHMPLSSVRDDLVTCWS